MLTREHTHMDAADTAIGQGAETNENLAGRSSRSELDRFDARLLREAMGDLGYEVARVAQCLGISQTTTRKLLAGEAPIWERDIRKLPAELQHHYRSLQLDEAANETVGRGTLSPEKHALRLLERLGDVARALAESRGKRRDAQLARALAEISREALRAAASVRSGE